MSSIYIQEPPTSGKVLLKTSVGDIDIELWSRECPKACRNFVQLCMEGYYDGTIFHRVVKGFIVQGGDPNGDGTGGESIYGQPFKDEFHSRLRYTRRGLVGMANSDKDDNGSQFFFTMSPTQELQNKNTLFAKVTGDTVFNMLKLEEGMVDHNERPLYPARIIKTEILNNPFEDIVPRELKKKDENKVSKRKKEKGVKNFGLLSFGEEAEGDEEETNNFVQTLAGKAKSMHDVVDDPKLSKDTLKVDKAPSDIEEYENPSKEDEEEAKERAERIKNKLLGSKKAKSGSKTIEKEKAESSESDDDYFQLKEKEKRAEKEQKKQEIQEEILSLKKKYKQEKKEREELRDPKPEKVIKKAPNELMKEFVSEQEKYSDLKKKVPLKGPQRQDFTLSLLKKFRNKLGSLKDKKGEDEESDELKGINEREVEEEIKGDDWLVHTLRFEDTIPVLAKDASTKSDDWYDAYDPRNPLNKRKRGDDPSSSKKKSSRR